MKNYKHYLTLNKNSDIIDAFCDAFKEPKETDTLYRDSDTRQFYLQITDDNGFYINKYIDNEIVEIPEPERGTEATRKAIEQLKVDTKKLALYTESNRLLAKSVYEIMKQGETVNPDTLAVWVAEVDKIKDDNPDIV